MTEQEAKICIQGKLDCMNKCDVFDCKGTDECDNCKYLYLQGTFGEQKQVFEMAIKALEEIQQYREIGTVEELKEAKEQYDNIYCAAKSVNLSGLCDFETAKKIIISEIKRNYKCSLRDYEAIGTPEECRAAVELMQEVFEKIIEKLEELKIAELEREDLCDEEGCGDGEEIYEDAKSVGRYEQTVKIIEIVKQEAEKFGTDTIVGSNGWIPVSERLPEEGGYYLVTYHECSNGNYLPKFDDTYVRKLHYQKSERFTGWNYPRCIDERAEADTNREVIAWQHLPEPFEE